MVVVTHNEELARACDRVLRLEGGSARTGLSPRGLPSGRQPAGFWAMIGFCRGESSPRPAPGVETGMFERYTERARRVIFFARYEASQLGSGAIETEHLLLGLIREGKGLTSRLFAKSHLSMDQIRKDVEGRSPYREKVSTSLEIPLSPECKRVLAHAADEAERMRHNYIGTEHILLGLMREERSVAAAHPRREGHAPRRGPRGHPSPS